MTDISFETRHSFESSVEGGTFILQVFAVGPDN